MKVLVTDHVFEHLERERSILEPLGCELVLAPGTEEAQLIDAVGDAEWWEGYLAKIQAAADTFR